jgi:serine/threonine-protein kinase
LNELAVLAKNQGQLDEAERDFQRMIAIYRKTYDNKHYLIGLGLSNLGSVYADRKDYQGAERCYQDALAQYAATLPADHLYVGITRLKLGRAFLKARRYAEAERESRVAYDIVSKQPEPPQKWLGIARTDLVAEYEALGRPQEAAKYRSELEQAKVAEGQPGR